MFTMAKIRNGSTYLGQHLAANDYYSEKETVLGQWHGRGAEKLGLAAAIHADDEAFGRLRENRHPLTDQKLTPRDCADRIRFLDFQCSAQKSVSVMAVTMGDTRLLAAHDAAAAVAFAELEKFAATQANSALHRENRLTGNLAAAVFRHTASRALDPQVHSHFVVANATWDETSKTWRALTEYEMVRAVRYAGKVYQNELARSCRRLGYDLTPTRDARGTVTGFEISGVSADIRTRFSKRRAEVERGIAEFQKEHGRLPTTAETHAITVDTRDPKLAEVTTPQVIAAQRAQLLPADLAGLEALRARAEARGRAEPEPTRERESLLLAVGHVFERRSVASGHEVMAEALNQNLGYLELRKLHAHADHVGLVALQAGPWLHRPLATERGLAQERWAVDFIGRTKEKSTELGRVDPAAVRHLSEEQRRAVAAVLATRDQVVCLRGAAGVGKSTVLKSLHSSLVGAGGEVWVCAPTSSAAETLRSDGIARATTVADFLQNVAPKEAGIGFVLVVDEAGLASNRQGAELLQLAERRGARVVFLGDTRQHSSVEAGDFLRILERHSPLHRVDLTDIRRQTLENYREAVRFMATGNARAGLEKLNDLGWVHEGKANYLAAAVGDFLRVSDNGRHLDSVLAVTPTWEENHAFTAGLRAELKTRGILRAGETVVVHEPLAWTRTQLARATNYTPGLVVTFNRGIGGFKRGEFTEVTRVEAGWVWVAGGTGEKPLPLSSQAFTVATARALEVCEGDRLLVRANDRSASLINGQTLTVSAVRDGIIETREGRRIDSKDFKAITHGFAVTSHRSQSKTTDHVIVAAARLDAKSVYVACSRGRLSCSVHTPEKASLIERLPEGTRPAAMDYLSPAHPSARDAAWSRPAMDGTAKVREELIRSALAQPWWRGVLTSLAEWSERALPQNWVDRKSSINTPDHSQL